ncbi:MAG: hypothetical protein WDW36_007692 [Sanguina aurantia]
MLQHGAAFVKGNFERCVPLGSYEAALRQGSLFGRTAGAGSISDEIPMATDHSAGVVIDPEGVEVKWGGQSSEPGMTLRGDPREWFRHHSSRLVQDSRARTAVPLLEKQFLRQLTLEHLSRDAALAAYKELRQSAEKRGELGELQPVKQLMASWMPAFEDAIAHEQMLYGPYIVGLNPAELGKLTIEAVLLTVTMSEVKRRSKAAARSGHATATAVVSAIGQRVQDTASFYAINATIEQKQKEYSSQRRYDRAHFRPRSDAGQGLEGLSGFEASGGGSDADDLQGGVTELDVYNQKMHQAAGRGRRIRLELLRMQGAAKEVRSGRARVQQHKILSHLDLASDVQSWDTAVRVRVGAALLTLLLHSAKVFNPKSSSLEPALSHAVEFDGERQQSVGVIRLHERTVFSLEDDEELRRGLTPKYMPMVIEPRPWTGTKTGGYLSLDEKVMKVRSSGSLWRSLREADTKGQLQNLCDALTVIGNVPWRINKEVYQVMQQLWETSTGEVLGLPSKTPERPPVKVTSLCKACPGLTPNLRLVHNRAKLNGQPARGGNGQLLVTAGPLTAGELYEHNQQTKAVRNANISASSHRNEFKHKMDVAAQFLDEQCIYFPHQVDFRGRAYTIHPHLQHLGDDVCRGLLQFSEGKVLGQRGLYWLKVQVANVYGKGKDKLSFDERVAWTEAHLDSIVDSASQPLAGRKWWQQGEKPWQLLATCKELYAAMSGDPETFVSHVSVHQDGSCNGLQHYAALGRDLEGGKSVNLVPSAQPQDVYKGVAQRVQEQVQLDACANNKLAIRLLESGGIGRSMVKQTVMTSVYGVTFCGARDQIRGKLQELGFNQEEELRQASTSVFFW